MKQYTIKEKSRRRWRKYTPSPRITSKIRCKKKSRERIIEKRAKDHASSIDYIPMNTEIFSSSHKQIWA